MQTQLAILHRLVPGMPVNYFKFSKINIIAGIVQISCGYVLMTLHVLTVQLYYSKLRKIQILEKSLTMD